MVHEELKKAVLSVLINNYVAIMPGAEVLPVSLIAKFLKQPVNDVRKALKELKHEGLVVYTYEGGYNEYFERIYCTWGYRISCKVTEFPEFIEAQRKEEEWVRENLRFEHEVKNEVERCE